MITVAQYLPVLLGSVWGGTIADRSELRRVLLLTQCCSAVLALSQGILAWTGAVQLWMIWVLATALGFVTIFDNPARHSLIMEMVGPEHLSNAVALNSASHSLGRVLGPAVAGITIGAIGVGPTFVLNAVSFVPMVAVLHRWAPTVRRSRDGRRRQRDEMVDGLRYLWFEIDVRTSLLLVLVVSVFAQNYRVLLPVLAEHGFAGGAGLYGTFVAVLGGGALVGTIIATHVERPTLRFVVVGGCAFGLLSLLVPAWSSIPAVCGVLVLLGVANSVLNTSSRSLELLAVAPAYRGRVMAVHQLMFVGGAPVGGLLLGSIAETSGAGWGFAVAGATVLTVLTVVVIVRLSRRRSGQPEEIG